MQDLLKSYEVAKHFNIPSPVAKRWSTDKGWKRELYKKLMKIMIEDMAQKAKEM